MAQSVSYGSQFKPFASTNTQSYGAYRPLAASLAGSPYYYGGGPYPQPAAQSPYYYGGGQAGTAVTYPFDSTVTPAKQTTSAQAPPSTFDPSAGAQVPSGPNAPSMDDLSTDPILQLIAAAGQRNVANARSAAMTNSENALIGYGSVNVPDSLRAAYASDQTNPILAALTDAATQQAAAANPDSTLMRLANQNTQNQARLNTGLNANNLFYSSTRGNDLGNLANSYRSAQNDAASALAGLLGQANTGVLNAEGGAQSDYLNALQGAWDRWMALNPPGMTTTTTQPTPTDTTTPNPTAAPSGELYYNPRTGQTVNYRPAHGLWAV